MRLAERPEQSVDVGLAAIVLFSQVCQWPQCREIAVTDDFAERLLSIANKDGYSSGQGILAQLQPGKKKQLRRLASKLAKDLEIEKLAFSSAPCNKSMFS